MNNDNNDDERGKFLNQKKENMLLKENNNNNNFSISKKGNDFFNIFEKEEVRKDENSNGENKSKEVICPKCEKSCIIDIFDYQILLYGCENNHKTNNIFFKEFEYTQIIDKNNIICDYCKESKKNKLLDDSFYTCLKCQMNLCSLCELNHDKVHNIINYEQKNYICNKHNKSYNSFCKTCTENICELCNQNHNSHEIIEFLDIMPNIYDLRFKCNELKNGINKLKENINDLIRILENVKKNFELFYQIYSDLVFSYDKKNLNYNLLYNINKISQKKDILEDINKIYNEEMIEKKFELIFEIYKKMNIKENNEITINYKIKKDEKQIKLFNHDFVLNNKDKCKIIYEDKENELKERFQINNKSEKLTIILKGIKNITQMKSLFCGCQSLLSIPDIWKWNTSNITDMNSLFSECTSLEYLPDISKWDTSKVKEMAYLFNKCTSLKYLPDISNWDTSKVVDMSHMFSGCSSLKYLPDIFKWDTSQVYDMSYMFFSCHSLENLPDISKWNVSKLRKKNFMFSECKNSLVIPPKFKESFFDFLINK